MKDSEKISRREFSQASVLALLSGVAITISGCGDSATTPSQTPNPTPPPTPPPSTTTGAEGVVGANHGHQAVLTEAQLTGGEAVTLSIDGTASHPHTVVLTADELRRIAAGQRVSKVSSVLMDDPLYPDVGTHRHSVTFN